MKIAKRIEGGWTNYQVNHNKYNCDDCGSRLYVAPDGKTKYCDNLSDKHLTEQQISEQFNQSIKLSDIKLVSEQ